MSHIVKWRADDVFVKEINESTCFQTFVGLGISDDFSESIRNALNKIDQFGLEPTLEVLNGFLATELGYNPRDEYGIDSDRAFGKRTSLERTNSEMSYCRQVLRCKKR